MNSNIKGTGSIFPTTLSTKADHHGILNAAAIGIAPLSSIIGSIEQISTQNSSAKNQPPNKFNINCCIASRIASISYPFFYSTKNTMQTDAIIIATATTVTIIDLILSLLALSLSGRSYPDNFEPLREFERGL